jgi:hypothetical protein
MSRLRTVVAALGVLLLGLPAVVQAQSSAPPSAKESGNPINDQGSNFNYRSTITGIAPHAPGLNLEVLQFADRLLVENHTGKTVTIYGYEGEPYARVLADGVVEENTHSPAYYLNENFYGDVNVPSFAKSTATPHWILVDRTGQFEWHDHRIHWMSPVTPPQVKDKSKRTKIFDWKVPIRVGAQPGVVDGQLFWVPEEGTKTPVAAIVALVVVVLGAIALVLFVRRRRRSGGPPDGAEASSAPGETETNGTTGHEREAW